MTEQNLKDEIRDILELYAKDRGTITYSELGCILGRIPNDRTTGNQLCELSRESHKERDVMLSAVVIHKNDDDLPGDRFFELAIELYECEILLADRNRFWDVEINRVYKAYPG